MTWYDMISCHIMSYHTISYHIISYLNVGSRQIQYFWHGFPPCEWTASDCCRNVCQSGVGWARTWDLVRGWFFQIGILHQNQSSTGNLVTSRSIYCWNIQEISCTGNIKEGILVEYTWTWMILRYTLPIKRYHHGMMGYLKDNFTSNFSLFLAGCSVSY